MPIEDVVRKTAKLARLALTDEEVERITPEFDKILGFVELIKELDVASVAPMESAAELSNVLRKDVPEMFPNV